MSNFSMFPYEQKVQILIGRKYDIYAELAIQRQRDTKPEDFQEYFDYVEQCKIEAREDESNGG